MPVDDECAGHGRAQRQAAVDGEVGEVEHAERDEHAQHHERIDGSGYPQKLKGENILIEARILAVADVVEAMMSYRPYRPALGLELALTEIESNSGTLYDHNAANACLKIFREKDFKL